MTYEELRKVPIGTKVFVVDFNSYRPSASSVISNCCVGGCKNNKIVVDSKEEHLDKNPGDVFLTKEEADAKVKVYLNDWLKWSTQETIKVNEILSRI